MSVKSLPAEARPREKLLSRGPAALSDAELLAILLRTGMAGKGVLQLAEEILQKGLPKVAQATRATHGAQAKQVQEPSAGPVSAKGPAPGFAALLGASAQDLKQIKGLGPAKQAEILAVMEMARRALAQRLQERPVLDSPARMGDYLRLHLGQLSHEVFAVLFLDAQHKLITLEELFRGTLSQTSVYPREVVLRALHHHASAVVLAHNHPSGQPEPSSADVALTRTLMAALGLVDVRVLDHIVVTAQSTLSMAEKGLM
jgi:DNA repair protein RadC